MDGAAPGAGRGGALTGVVLAEAPNWVDVTGLYVQEGMLAFAVLQFFLGIAGTIALIVTLRESRRATATAMRALHVQQSAERALFVVGEVRSYLRVPERLTDPHDIIGLVGGNDVTVRVRASFTNNGRSLGLVRRTALQITVGNAPTRPDFSQKSTSRNHKPVDQGGEISVTSPTLQLTDAEYHAVLNSDSSLWAWAFIEYDDVFGDHHRLSCAYEIPKFSSRNLREFGDDSFWQQS